MTDYGSLISKAEAAGYAALTAATPRPMIVTEARSGQEWFEGEGLCGFAWVKFKGNTEFGRWMKKYGKASKSYPNGLCRWVSEGGQSVERKEAYARAYAKVLNEAGIADAYADSRLD